MATYYLPVGYIHAFNVMHATRLPASEDYFFITPKMLTSEHRILILEGFKYWGITSITSSATMISRATDEGVWLYFTEGSGVAMSYIPKINPLYAHIKKMAPVKPRRSARLAKKY